MRLTGLGLFVLALSHYLITHFVYDPAIQDADWVTARWSNIAWRTADWLMLTFVVFHAFMGMRIDRRTTTRRAALRTVLTMVLYLARDRAVRPRHDRRRDAADAGSRRDPRPRRARSSAPAGAGPVGRAGARQGRRRLRGPDQALPDPLPHRRRAGRRVCRPGQPGGGPLGVAHVRHHQGWRLPGGPGRGRGARPRGHRDGDRARAHGPAVQPDARRAGSTSAGSAATPGTSARGRSSGRASRPTGPAT